MEIAAAAVAAIVPIVLNDNSCIWKCIGCSESGVKSPVALDGESGSIDTKLKEAAAIKAQKLADAAQDKASAVAEAAAVAVKAASVAEMAARAAVAAAEKAAAAADKAGASAEATAKKAAADKAAADAKSKREAAAKAAADAGVAAEIAAAKGPPPIKLLQTRWRLRRWLRQPRQRRSGAR